MSTDLATPPAAPISRESIDERYRWDLTHVFETWEEWQAACDEASRLIDRYLDLQGSLDRGPEALRTALELADEIGRLSYRVWYYPSLTYDLDQRDNQTNARRQQVQILFARWQQASAWFSPELLRLPFATLDEWMEKDPGLAHYRFKIEDLYRVAEHVLGDEGERVLSNASRFADTPDDAYSALTTADVKFPSVTLGDGREIQLTHGQYRRLLATCRDQSDRAKVFEAFYGVFAAHLNTYAALYQGVCQRDWFQAQSRHYGTTLEAALDGNAIPTSVVEELIATTRAGVAPLQRYQRLRQRTLGVETYHLYDTSIPLLEGEERYEYDEAATRVAESVAPLGSDYQQQLRRAFEERWIDVYESAGKRSGAYSAGVYGVHPYVLLNYNETLNDVFTLAHELGHTMHSILSQESQSFTYARYTIFVAEVASTLNEALLLDTLLDRAESAHERITLLEHAIDSIVGTFYIQVMFAQWELEAHRRVEGGEPVTADSLSDLYFGLLQDFYGDAVTLDPDYRITWARIPHFFQSPYYVYQYATSFAASAQLAQEIRAAGSPYERQERVDSYLRLLRSGGSAHPVDQLRTAGVDLTRPEPVQAVVTELDRLVTQLEAEIETGL